MILPRFGQWAKEYDSYLVWIRVYLFGTIWTPFCRVIRRQSHEHIYPYQLSYTAYMDKTKTENIPTHIVSAMGFYLPLVLSAVSLATFLILGHMR